MKKLSFRLTMSATLTALSLQMVPIDCYAVTEASNLKSDLSNVKSDASTAKSDSEPRKTGSVTWQKWDDSVFERAQKENKFVILDLEAVWCHWCHVMDEETYSNSQIGDLINSKFIPVKVDQDSRPDLSHKYEDYGWPATIIFDPSGKEIRKRRGYIRLDDMKELLNGVVSDPKPEAASAAEPKFVAQSFLSDDMKKELVSKHVKGYDTKFGAWGTFHKFLDWDSAEYAMLVGLTGDKVAEQRARQSLTAQLKLLDPVWGGVYQYSTDGDWDHAHFEKIMEMQGENLRIYSLGSIIYNDETYTNAAKKIASYLKDFLTSPDGAFYTSQDADLVPGQHSEGYFALNDAKRRKQGIPRIDKHVYARENGWAITGLTYLYMATGDETYLKQATKAADWIVANRSIDGGGFRHDEKDAAGPFLGDSLAMGRAFLALYEATADRQYLSRAQKCADFIAAHFSNTSSQDANLKAGYLTADPGSSKVAKPEPLLNENIMLARFTNLLYRYTGKDAYKKMSEQTLRYLATPEIARKRKVFVAGILMADRQLATPPVHVTIVGSKADAEAKNLYLTAIKSPSVYRRIEWYDRAEGALPNMDVEYPELKKAAAFSCGNGTCSTPAYDAASVVKMVERNNRM